MQRVLFVTGTDTDVGKTIVTAGLLRGLRARGIDAVSMKPVQTGAERIDGRLVAPDLLVHWDAASLAPDLAEQALMAPYLYEPACSPHLAGRMAGAYPDIVHIVSCAQALLDSHQALLMEGADGLMAPLDESHTMLDLMQALGAPVILAAHRGLGTINHTLLALAALRAAKLDIAGVILNETRDVPVDFIRSDNPDAIEQFGNVRVLGNVDYLPALDNAGWNRLNECLSGIDYLLEKLELK